MARHGWARVVLPAVLFLACLVSSGVSADDTFGTEEKCAKLMKVVRWCGERKHWKNDLQRYMVKKLASSQYSNMVRSCLTSALDPSHNSSYCEGEKHVKLFLMCSRIALFRVVSVPKKFPATRFHNGYEHCVKLNMGIKMGTGKSPGVPDMPEEPDDGIPKSSAWKRLRRRRRKTGRPHGPLGWTPNWINVKKLDAKHPVEAEAMPGRMPGLPLDRPPADNEHDNMHLPERRRRRPVRKYESYVRKDHMPRNRSDNVYYKLVPHPDSENGVNYARPVRRYPDGGPNMRRRRRHPGSSSKHGHRGILASIMEPGSHRGEHKVFGKTKDRHHPSMHGHHAVPASVVFRDNDFMAGSHRRRHGRKVRHHKRKPKHPIHRGVPASEIERDAASGMHHRVKEMFAKSVERHRHPAKHVRPNRASSGSIHRGRPASALRNKDKSSMHHRDKEIFATTVESHHHPAKHVRPNRTSSGSIHRGRPASALRSKDKSAMHHRDKGMFATTVERHRHPAKHVRPNRASSGSIHRGILASALLSKDKSAMHHRDKEMFDKTVESDHHPAKHVKHASSGSSYNGGPEAATGTGEHPKETVVYAKSVRRGNHAASTHDGHGMHHIKPHTSSLASNDEHSVEGSSRMRRRHRS